jgi:MFS family permease
VSATADSLAEPAALSAGAVLVLTLGALDFGLEQSIVVPALPRFAVDYHASLIAVGWLATAFLLSAIVAVPLFGRLGDIYGKRRLLLVCLGAFAAGSFASAVSDSIALAIAGRALQGLGAAVAPLTLGLVRDSVPPELLPRIIGAVIGAANVGGAVGFLMSGILVDAFSSAAVFWFLFLFGVVLFAGVAAAVREPPARAAVPLDTGGAILLGGGLVALLLAISKGTAWGWSSATIVGLFAGSALLLALFGVHERRARDPLVDLQLVVNRPFANTNLCAAGFGFAFFTATVALPLIAAAPGASGYGLGLSTTRIGLLLVPTSVAGLVASWLGGRFVERIGPRSLAAVGSLLGVAGYVSLALAHATTFALGAASAVLGLAWGFILTALYPVVLRGASAERSAIAAAVTLLFRNASLSVGVTVTFVLITSAGRHGPFPADAGFTRVFLVAAAGAAATFAAALLLPRRADL